MKPLRNNALIRFAAVLALAVISLAQTGTPLANPEVRRLGDMLVCLCGCQSTVTSCNMLHCHFSDPAREKLLTMVNSRMSDQQILDTFVAENGLQILNKPPSEGFNLLGWVMPFVMLAAGLVFLWWIIQRFRRPAPAAPVPEFDAATLARYEERAEEEIEKLDR